jgi:hypothetical protein
MRSGAMNERLTTSPASLSSFSLLSHLHLYASLILLLVAGAFLRYAADPRR